MRVTLWAASALLFTLLASEALGLEVKPHKINGENKKPINDRRDSITDDDDKEVFKQANIIQ